MDNRISFRLGNEEFQMIKKVLGEHTISSYLRQLILLNGLQKLLPLSKSSEKQIFNILQKEQERRKETCLTSNHC